MADNPQLSIVVVLHNMLREAQRSLYALSRAYQRNVDDLNYEVLVIDSGSTKPLSTEMVRSFGKEFRYEYWPTDSVSPVDALNHAAQGAGENLMIMIDGAHMLSPGVLSSTVRAFRAFDNPFVATLPMHLGPGRQDRTANTGYNQEQEDALLAKIDWKTDGYELFRLAGSTSDSSLGWFGCLFESNCFALRKSTFNALGRFHPGFQSRGGGLVNLDFFRQAVETSDIDYILLLGEASFHQIHGRKPYPMHELHQEYEAIRGRTYDRPRRHPTLFGALSRQAMPHAEISARLGIEWWQKNG